MFIKYISTFVLIAFLNILYSQEQNTIFSKKIDSISICSFNIQFLGHFKNREDSLLAELLKPYDVVVIQEMVAPPISGTYPDLSRFKKDKESASFTNRMVQNGFSFWLSPEDTGPKRNHTNSTSSEWWITFYKPEILIPDSSKFYGFLDSITVASSKYQRVPYSMPFMSSLDSSHLFSLISLHLQPGNRPNDREIRANELSNLVKWSKEHGDSSTILLLGDCNIYTSNEYVPYNDIGFYSLNDRCEFTNTKMYEDSTKGKPYDHVFYLKDSMNHWYLDHFEVIDLMDYYKKTIPPPLFNFEPYDHDLFRTSFSDHLPITFKFYYITIDQHSN